MNSGLTSSPAAARRSPHVVGRDADALAGALAAGLQAGLAGERDRRRRRRTRRGSRASSAPAEAVAVGQQHHHRDDAPRDAEHRQRRAEAVAGQADEGLAHDLAQHAATSAARARGTRGVARTAQWRQWLQRSSHLEPQRLDRRQLRGAARRIRRRDDADRRRA